MFIHEFKVSFWHFVIVKPPYSWTSYICFLGMFIIRNKIGKDSSVFWASMNLHGALSMCIALTWPEGSSTHQCTNLDGWCIDGCTFFIHACPCANQGVEHRLTFVFPLSCCFFFLNFFFCPTPTLVSLTYLHFDYLLMHQRGLLFPHLPTYPPSYLLTHPPNYLPMH